MILVVLVSLIPVVRSAVLPNIIFGSYGVLLLGANPKDGTSESGFKGQIFDFSFDNKDDNNCWSNGYVGEGYQIPDCYCGHYWPRGSTSLHNGALFAHSSEEYQIGLSTEMTFAQSGTIGGIFVDFGKYSFEYSKGFNFTGSFFNSQTGVVITSKCFHESYYVELNERFSPSNRNLLALSEDFLFDVSSLPVQYDVRKYVDFLKAWGDHYTDKMTMGGYVVGLSYFSDKNYQATVATGIDITATAEKDAWFRGTTSNSGGGSTDESVKIYQSYADGGQFLAFRSHPPPASGDLNQWDKDVDSYPFPILMGLAPITNLLTSEWFPNNSNINSIQSNMARAINDFCTVENCFVPKPPPPPPQPTVSAEYVLTGKGSNKISLGHQHKTSFCFITRGRAWYESGEVCHLTREGDGWFLAFNSGQPDFECGARCVENFSFTGYTQEFINTGSRQGSISEIPVQSGFCFLTYGSTWGGDDGCWTSDQDGGGSWKNSRSVTDDHADSFVCGSTCVYWKTPTTNNYFLTKSGKGNNSDRMQPVSTHFCYISYGAHWYMGGERCMVQPKEDGYWYLVYNSGQDHFGCQAQCISFN